MRGDWFVVKFQDGKQVQGRLGMEQHKNSGAYPFRIELFWEKGSDEDFDADMTGKLEEQMIAAMERDQTAFLVMITEEKTQTVLTWHAKSIDAFSDKMNAVFSLFPPLPVSVFSMNDEKWEAYEQILKIVRKLN